MPSTKPQALDPEERDTLLELAQSSIAYGLEHGRPLPVDPSDFAPPLDSQRASFVTLRIGGELRGCIGTLEAYQSLVEDIAQNAFNAAFRDPRFFPLSAAEFDALDIHISILNPSEPMNVVDEADLLNQLRPGIDGLIIESEGHRATFLPSVWEQLPEPGQFLLHLKHKAGLPGDYWSVHMQVRRYTTTSFGAGE